MLETVTFLLAFIGYTGMAATVAASATSGLPRGVWRLTVLIVLVHVWLVWDGRYGWDIAQATRNGYTDFLIFHSALVAMVVSTMLEERQAIALIRAAFAIVSIGALGAVSRYDVVAVYRIPVYAVLVIAAGVITWKRFRL